jgi:hypothetical protein
VVVQFAATRIGNSANASARLFAAYVCQRTEIYRRKA